MILIGKEPGLSIGSDCHREDTYRVSSAAYILYCLMISEKAFHKTALVDLAELVTGLLKLSACSFLPHVPY